MKYVNVNVITLNCANTLSHHHTHPHRDDTVNRVPYKARQIEGPGLFYLGIIDYLQKYTFAKKLERFYKRFFRCYDKQGISDVPPRDYCDRFVERVIGRVRALKWV